MLGAFGSYFVGGRALAVAGEAVREVPVTQDVTLRVDPNGTHMVGHGYVQWFAPAQPADATPVVLVHGGGMCGSVWEHTPDGRPGWLHGLLAAGREVHVLDSPERGRAGWSPFAAPEPPVVRTLEDAWTLFRLGPPDGFAGREPFAGQRFPTEALEEFGRFFVPRWTSQAEAQADALAAVLTKLGRVTLIAHSQGCETAVAAMSRAPGCVAEFIAIEPSIFPSPEALAGRPFTLVSGGFLDTAPIWRRANARWTDVVQAHAAAGAESRRIDLDAAIGPGFSHMPMHDRGSHEALAAVLDGLRATRPHGSGR